MRDTPKGGERVEAGNHDPESKGARCDVRYNSGACADVLEGANFDNEVVNGEPGAFVANG